MRLVGEMDLVALAEDVNLVPSTHMVFATPVSGYLIPSSGFHRLTLHTCR